MTRLDQAVNHFIAVCQQQGFGFLGDGKGVSVGGYYRNDGGKEIWVYMDPRWSPQQRDDFVSFFMLEGLVLDWQGFPLKIKK